jgi:hypothetical protein
MVPATGGSLFMGRNPEYVLRNYGEVVERNKGKPLIWRDLMWMYLALADADQAMDLFKEDPYFRPEFGNSVAFTYHWIANLQKLGQLDTTVTANIPTYAVFNRNGSRTHVAYNPTNAPISVKFSDNTSLEIKPRKLGVRGGGLN